MTKAVRTVVVQWGRTGRSLDVNVLGAGQEAWRAGEEAAGRLVGRGVLPVPPGQELS